MKPTNEQVAIIESEGNIKINAVAGSGKTTTLIEYARARPDKKILYIAFNKSVKTEAVKRFADKGLNNVTVETAHSLAYKHVVRNSGYKVKKDGEYKTMEVADILGFNHWGQKHDGYVLANHINKFVAYFCNSDKEKVEQLNYEDVVFDREASKFARNFKSIILKGTRELLAKMDKGEIDIIHDFYLKKFHLMKVQLGYDHILFDEGQDASGAMLEVFLNQQGVKVIVGDTHQQIYGWRFAVNSLEKVDYPTFHLSSSFRFGNEIAALASGILKWKGLYGPYERVIINGYGDSDSTKSKATLARTNTALLIMAIEQLIEKKSIDKLYFEGRFESYTYADEGASIYDVLNLYLGKRSMIRDKLIASMADMVELEDYIEKTEDAQLALIAEVVEKYGEELPGHIKTIKAHHIEADNKDSAEMVFSTVHRCKGMEYDVVTLANDFITEAKIRKWVDEYGVEKMNMSKMGEEINLLYVAVTRTKNVLHIPAELLPETKVKVIQTIESEVEQPYKTDIAAQTGIETDKKSFIDEMRKTDANAYMPWTDEADRELTSLFVKEVSVKDMCKLLGRGDGAIRSRIKKLELKDIYG